MRIEIDVAASIVRDARRQARMAKTRLDSVITKYLVTYGRHGNPASKGAINMHKQRSPTERSEAARKAVRARWARVNKERNAAARNGGK